MDGWKKEMNEEMRKERKNAGDGKRDREREIEKGRGREEESAVSVCVCPICLTSRELILVANQQTSKESISPSVRLVSTLSA